MRTCDNPFRLLEVVPKTNSSFSEWVKAQTQSHETWTELADGLLFKTTKFLLCLKLPFFNNYLFIVYCQLIIFNWVWWERNYSGGVETGLPQWWLLLVLFLAKHAWRQFSTSANICGRSGLMLAKHYVNSCSFHDMTSTDHSSVVRPSCTHDAGSPPTQTPLPLCPRFRVF